MAESEDPERDADESRSAGDDQERTGAEALLDRYRSAAAAPAAGPPWAWSSLSPAETDALVEMVDGFVADYNEVWALTDDDDVPPCWHRHPALAHDLAALTWAWYQAHRDPAATPDLAARFQDHLWRFRRRVDVWLGADPAACRDNRHARTWRSTGPAPAPAARESSEERDAVTLLGSRSFGFPSPHRPPTG